jgi:predicted RNA-binding Zn-ribbon protein involved in translation (DUF1610 family)
VKRLRKMLTPVNVLAFLLGSVPRLASDPRLRQESSGAVNRSPSVEAPDEVRHAAANAERGLHVCPRCGSKFVQPTRWEQTESRVHWHIWRRCPECGWHSDAVHGEHEIDLFDEALDEGSEMLSEELKELEREGVREIAEVFTAALAADLITADDFRL